MNAKALALQERTHQFFTRVIRFCERLPLNRTTAGIGGHLWDSAGGADSSCRIACRARSPQEFMAKIAAAAEEADESRGWLSALLSRDYGDSDETRMLIREACELTAIFTASQARARRRVGEGSDRADPDECF